MPATPTLTIFFGTSSFAVPALERLAALDDIEVVAVITQPDEPVGRKQTLTPPPVKVAADRLGLTVWQPKTLKDENVSKQIADAKPDVGVVAAYGKIIPQNVLDAFPHGLLNIHPSLLPRHRGPSPIQTAIAADDREIGVTIIKLDALMDHGPIVTQKTLTLTGHESAPQLSDELAALSADLLVLTLIPYCDGRLTPRDQEHARATVTHLLTRDDGRVDATMPREQVERLFRAYHPWPGIWTTFIHHGRPVRVKICDLDIKNDALNVQRVQPEGKREMSYADFKIGYGELFPQHLQK